MKNTSNTSSENEFTQQFAKQIEKLVGLKKWDFEKQVEQKWEKKAILDILKQNQDNENLAIFLIENKDWKYVQEIDVANRTKAIIKSALWQNIATLKFASEEMKSDPDMAYTIITTYIKSWKNFLDVEQYLDTYFTDSKYYNSLIKHYLKTQKTHWVLARNDLTSLLIDIKTSKFYKHLKTQKSITGIGNYVKPSNSLIVSFLKNADDASLDAISDQQEKDAAFLKVFTLVINSHPDSLSEQEKLVFNKILEICISEYNKKFIPDNKQKKEESEKNTSDYWEEFEQEIDFEDYTPKEKLDYCYPTRSYSVLDNGNYSVTLESNKKLEISADEMKSATVKALENYAIFYETLCSAKLEFLWKKYKKPFSVACSNAFWFNHLRWEWITSNKLLQVLNFVWRNIGVPEHEYKDDNWETISELRCFDDIMTAEKTFKWIQKSGYINTTLIDSNPDGSERRVVEQHLIQLGLLDGKGWFNILSWK